MKLSELETINEAARIARAKRCFVVTKPGHWLLYRESTPKNVFIGKRSSAKGILQLAKKA